MEHSWDEHMLGQKSGLGKPKKTEITRSTLFNHESLRPETNYKGKSRKNHKHAEVKQLCNFSIYSCQQKTSMYDISPCILSKIKRTNIQYINVCVKCTYFIPLRIYKNLENFLPC